MKIALAQFSVSRGEPEANLDTIIKYIESAKVQQASVLFLPEMCTTGFNWARNRALLAEAHTHVERVRAYAEKFGISVCGSFLEKTETGNMANTLYYFSADGVELSKYRKVHLFTLFHEELHVEPGSKVVVGETDFGMTGFSICYDLRFPELFRKCALSGAAVQVLPAAFPYPRLEHWQTLIRARAIENQSFFIATNQCGYEGHGADVGKTQYFGHSMVVDPWGEVLLEAGDREGLFTVDIDLSKVGEIRKHLTALKDRRPELY